MKARRGGEGRYTNRHTYICMYYYGSDRIFIASGRCVVKIKVRLTISVFWKVVEPALVLFAFLHAEHLYSRPFPSLILRLEFIKKKRKILKLCRDLDYFLFFLIKIVFFFFFSWPKSCFLSSWILHSFSWLKACYLTFSLRFFLLYIPTSVGS